MGNCIGNMCFFKKGKEKYEVPKDQTFFGFKMKDIHGNEIDFSSFKGKYKAFLVVNVASACGLTGTNYRQLAKFHDEFESKGLKILGFPCNQFLGQENKCDLDIAEFVRTKFKVKFDMFSKIEVNGENCHPLYRFLRVNSSLYDPNTGECKQIKWNFTKFILNRQGEVVLYKEPNDKPESFRLEIENLLKNK